MYSSAGRRIPLDILFCMIPPSGGDTFLIPNGHFKYFEERAEGSRVSRRDVFLPAREQSHHVGRFQVLLVSFRFHVNRVAFTVDREHHRSVRASRATFSIPRR